MQIAGATIGPALEIHHPEYGDMTEDVARELALIRQQDHEELLRTVDRDQAAIAHGTPGEARLADGFALKAQIDPRVVAYWRQREGSGFWKHELDNFLKKHPECRVKRHSDKTTVSLATAPGHRISGKRGRWAL